MECQLSCLKQIKLTNKIGEVIEKDGKKKLGVYTEKNKQETWLINVIKKKSSLSHFFSYTHEICWLTCLLKMPSRRFQDKKVGSDEKKWKRNIILYSNSDS